MSQRVVLKTSALDLALLHLLQTLSDRKCKVNHPIILETGDTSMEERRLQYEHRWQADVDTRSWRE